MRRFVKDSMVRMLWLAMGRRNLVRLARILTDGARLDVPNDMATNGELYVQDTVMGVNKEKGGAVVFDVGANVGTWTRLLLARADRHDVATVVHAFEPCQGTARSLQRNIREWGLENRAVVNEVALSSVAGQRVLYSLGDDEGRNSLYPLGAEEKQLEGKVDATTLDLYCEAAGISHIALLKIDTEGHDLEVIRGGRALFEGRGVDIVQFEYNIRWIPARCFLADTFAFFGPLGYKIGKVTPLGIEVYRQWHPELETFREANYVAALPQILAQFRTVLWWNDRG